MDCRYNVMLTILTYFLPICAMGYAYFQVGVELWGSQGIGECTDHQMENVRSKRRVRQSIDLLYYVRILKREEKSRYQALIKWDEYVEKERRQKSLLIREPSGSNEKKSIY